LPEDGQRRQIEIHRHAVNEHQREIEAVTWRREEQTMESLVVGVLKVHSCVWMLIRDFCRGLFRLFYFVLGIKALEETAVIDFLEHA
jgi:hypothetical protein